MANTFKFGNGKWAVKDGYALAYNDENGNFKPLPFDFTRATRATRVNKDGLIEVVPNNEPRIDFLNDSNGALLLEPSRTNIYSFSNQFDVFWSKINVSAIPNSVTSLDGNLNGYLLQENTSNASHDIRQNATVVSGQQYTYSVFVKKSDVGQDRNLSFYIGGPNGSISFNTTNGTFFSVSSIDSYSSEYYGNGWWRLQFTDTSVSTSFNVIAILNNGSTIYQGDGTSGLYIYGAQLEQGSYATSYIPTQGGAVTRVDEVCSDAGNNQVINSTEGVIYCEIASLVETPETRGVIGISVAGNTDNRVTIEYNAGDTNLIRAQVRTSSLQAIIGYVVTSIKDFHKVALVYQLDNVQLWIDGVKRDEDLNADVSSPNTISMAAFLINNTNNFQGKCKGFRIYDTVLTDAELQALTT
jgi:hypothetical protein